MRAPKDGEGNYHTPLATGRARVAREDQDVPANVRCQVLERDGHCCRVCGRYVAIPALHHIEYRSEGGPDTVDNLITIGWLPGHDCHLSVVHANKRVWQPILREVVAAPAYVTAFAIRRAQLADAHSQEG